MSGSGSQAPDQPGLLPAHLPRIEIVLDIDDKACRCCAAQSACRTCGDGVMQASGPARLIEGGSPTESVRDRLSQTISF
jgi:transposase